MRRANRVGDQGDQDYYGYGAAYGYGNEQNESQADWAEAGEVPPTHSLTADLSTADSSTADVSTGRSARATRQGSH